MQNLLSRPLYTAELQTLIALLYRKSILAYIDIYSLLRCVICIDGSGDKVAELLSAGQGLALANSQVLVLLVVKLLGYYGQ